MARGSRTRIVGWTTALIVLVAVLASAYIAWPFYTAWTIREAIETDDSAYLARKVDWPAVRTTLKASLVEAYALTPPPGTAEPAEPPPGWWQRTKSFVGRGAIDRFVETTITPDGLHTLFSLRKSYRRNVLGEDDTRRPPFWDRVRETWSRVVRAEMTAFDRVELDMIDKHQPARTLGMRLELRGLEWILTAIRVSATAKAAPRPPAPPG